MDFNSSTLWGIISIISGILVSFFFYYIGKNKSSIVYTIKTQDLVLSEASDLEGLCVYYKNKPIKSLRVSTVNIGNTGNSLIVANDFSLPLSIVTTGEFFLYLNNNIVAPLLFGNLHLQFDSTESNNLKKILVKFDYIPKKASISYTIYHTGELSIIGKLKDGKTIRCAHTCLTHEVCIPNCTIHITFDRYRKHLI